MKKIYLLIAFVAATVDANSQEVFSVEGKIPQIIPGELTADGKSRMYVRVTRDEGDKFYIYNENMELETTFEVAVPYSVTVRTETATVPGTSTWDYDASNAVWGLKSEETQTGTVGKVDNIDAYYNMDKGSGMEDCDIYLTQTLFNNDEDWEFVMENYGYSYVGAQSYDANTGTVSLVRTSIIDEGVKIYNQHGQLVTTIGDTGVHADAIWIANGKKYLSTRDTSKSSTGDYLNKVFLVNGSGSGSGKGQVRADVNEDGTVNGTDIQEVINFIVNAE